NHLIECGYAFSLRMLAIFPGCRKSVTVSETPMAGYVWLKPLYGYNGRANISPSAWRSLINSAFITVWQYSDTKVTLTPEIEKMARDYYLRVADSAERQLANTEMVCDEHRARCESGEIYTKIAVG